MPRFSIKALLLFTALVGATLGFFLLSELRSSRPESPKCSCENRFKLIAVALQNYHDSHGHFPPACTYDANGRPLHSWRVLILPYMEQIVPYSKLDLRQPWNSPHNWQIIESIDMGEYHCPAVEGDWTETSYLAVVGEGTMCPAAIL